MTDETEQSSEPEADSGAPEGSEPEELAQLGERIRKVRSEAEEVIPGVGDEHEERFEDSGSDPEDDDQNIAPG